MQTEFYFSILDSSKQVWDHNHGARNINLDLKGPNFFHHDTKGVVINIILCFAFWIFFIVSGMLVLYSLVLTACLGFAKKKSFTSGDESSPALFYFKYPVI